MKTNKYPLILLFVLALLIAAGCSRAPATTEAPTMPPATPTLVPAQTVPPQVSEEPTQVASEEPTAEPGEAPETSPEASAPENGQDYCLECHTDQQMLIDTAKPEEEVASENEGEG
jgi:hypothetical protein